MKFATVGEVEKAAQAFQKKWKNASEEKCLALGRDEEFKELLKATEAFEKDVKASYRWQRRGSVLEDIEDYSPKWEAMKEERQEATKAQLNTLRELRAQIIATFRPEGELLKRAGIKGEYNEAGAWACDSSDDEQWCSRETSRTCRVVGSYAGQIALGVGIGFMTGGAGLVTYSTANAVFDSSLRTSIREGDLGGTLDHLTYHVPLIGTVRGAWEAGHAACDAWDEGHYGEVAWHASTAALQVTSLEADAKLGLAKGKAQRLAPKSVNQLNTLVKKGKAPKSIRRFDQKKRDLHTLVEHVHFKDGSAFRKDGVWRHGYKDLTKEEIKFLKFHGWTIPE